MSVVLDCRQITTKIDESFLGARVDLLLARILIDHHDQMIGRVAEASILARNLAEILAQIAHARLEQIDALLDHFRLRLTKTRIG